jgi:primosomal protein N' (replication factor Y)
MIIQSANAGHYCFQALIKHDPRIFLTEELKQRKQLDLPPYKHMLLVKLRGRNAEKVKEAALGLSERLIKLKNPAIKVISVNPGQPAKLRDNFYYQILIRASRVQAACRLLKLHLKETNYSGIIVTVDVDPV